VVLGRIEPIPTVIADTPIRYPAVIPPDRESHTEQTGFGAVLPGWTGTGASSPGGGGRIAATPADPNAHGLIPADLDLKTAIRCPNCGLILPAGRRFCRCGASLLTPAPAQDWVDPEERQPWHRRIRDGIGSGAKFWRAMRRANHGARARFGRARSLRDHTVRWLAAVGVTVVGVSQLGPWGGQLRDDAFSRVSARLPWSYTSVRADGTTTDPPEDDRPGLGPGFAVDLDRSTAWATAWAEPTAGGEPCDRPAGAARLTITFTNPVDVDRVRVLPGMPSVSPDQELQNRPKVVDVRLSDRSCGTMTFDKASGEGSVELSGDNITSMTVSIVDVHPAPTDSSAAASLVAITEVIPEFR